MVGADEITVADRYYNAAFVTRSKAQRAGLAVLDDGRIDAPKGEIRAAIWRSFK